MRTHVSNIHLQYQRASANKSKSNAFSLTREKPTKNETNHKDAYRRIQQQRRRGRSQRRHLYSWKLDRRSPQDCWWSRWYSWGRSGKHNQQYYWHQGRRRWIERSHRWCQGRC